MFPRRFSGRRLLRLRFGDNHPVADLCETSDIQSLANHLPELAGFADLALLCACFRKEFGRDLGTHWLTQTLCGVRLVQRRDVDLRLPDGLLFPESSSHAFIRELCVTLSVGTYYVASGHRLCSLLITTLPITLGSKVTRVHKTDSHHATMSATMFRAAAVVVCMCHCLVGNGLSGGRWFVRQLLVSTRKTGCVSRCRWNAGILGRTSNVG